MQRSNIPQASQFRDGVPVANKRAQRRSRSAENWLDHKPTTLTKTGKYCDLMLFFFVRNKKLIII